MARPRPNEDAVREQLKEMAAPEPEAEPAPDREPEPEPEPEAEPATPGEPPKGSDPQGSDPGGSDPLANVPARGADPDGEPTPGEPASEQEDPLAQAERERDEYLDLAQRTRAELENFRKRAARETSQAGVRAKANLVRELLPVLDNLERALDSAGDGEQHLAEGVRMVHAQLVAALEREGIQAYDPAGEPFDPECHEALSTREDGESGRVLDVVEKGYRLNGTVLRPARVVVSA